MTIVRSVFVAVVAIGVGAACSGRDEVEQLPIGAKVEVTRADGGVVRGTLKARNASTVQVAVGPVTRSIERDTIRVVERVDGATVPPLPAVARFREVVVPEGTPLTLRLNSALASDTSHVEDQVEATLVDQVRVDDVEVMPSGSVLYGTVTSADPAGRVRGRASLGVRFRSIAIAGGAVRYAIAASVHRTAAATRSADAKTIGIPAAGGAIIGGIVGGKKGAGIGAVVGGSAGAAVTLATAGPDIRFPVGTVLSTTLDDALDVRVPIRR